jgi:hypothetical protein
MHGEPSPRSDRGCTTRTTTDEDAQAQHAVLAVVLDQHPALLTLYELAREISHNERDGIERAIRDLIGAGLLRCEGASVLPTRAALHFDQIAA